MKFLLMCAVVILVYKTEAYNNNGGIDTELIRDSAMQAKFMVNRALKATRDGLKARKKRATLSIADIVWMLKSPKGRSSSMIRAAEYHEAALKVIQENLKNIYPGNINATDLMTAEQKVILSQLTGCAFQYLPEYCPRYKYRTITGECNNRKNPTLGSSNTGLKRILAPEYEDNRSIPKGWSDNCMINGHPLPSARAVSNYIVSYGNKAMPEDGGRSQVFVHFGQFIDHDMTLSPDTPAKTTFYKGVDCNTNCIKEYPCYPIMIPENDPKRQQSECIPLFRSAAVCNLAFTYREQINVLTAFIDLSQVYGSENTVALRLRNTSSKLGLLAVNQNYTDQGRYLLPFDEVNGETCLLSNKSAAISCFFTGDTRVSEQLGISTLQTLWFREHNRIATELHKLNPHWCDEKLYQESRKILSCIMQKITFKDWLYLLLGIKKSSVVPLYTYYDDTTDPSVSNVFTNAFRMGHTMVNRYMYLLDDGYQPYEELPVIPFQNTFFNPEIFIRVGMDRIMRGLMANPAKLNVPDKIMDDGLRNHLFEMEMNISLDLASLNIQRSRDHGLPGYCAWREFCGLSVPTNEAELAVVLKNPVLAKKLMQLYGNPKNIDVWMGGVSEPLVVAGRVGELMACLIGDQFTRARNGDRFYYENEGVLSDCQRNAIENVTLSSLICANTNITKVPINPFLLNNYSDFVPCSRIPKLNLTAWKDTCETGTDDICP